MPMKDVFLPLVGGPSEPALAAIEKCVAAAADMGVKITALAVEEDILVRPKLATLADLDGAEETEALRSVTDANGLFIANLTTTAAEVKTITVVADPGRAEVVLDERPSVTFRAGPATHVDIALDGDGKKATLTARDFFGNLAGEYRTTVIETNASEH